MKDFEIVGKVGQGLQSTVFKVKRIIDGSIYALKQVRLFNLNEKQIHNAVNQVRLLASIRHPNIISYKEAFYDITTKSLCIVMEYADGGDLLQKIVEYKNRSVYFNEDYIWKIFYYTLKALKVLHDMKILHRDIKSANIFLTRVGKVKLGDMNVSKVLKKDSMCQTQTGTPFYASPQVWQDDPYDAKSDIWSLGCVLYELITFRPPFRGRDMEGLYKKIARGYYPKIPKQYSQDLTELLKMLINVKPNERLNCGQLIEHPIVRKHTKQFREAEFQEKSQLLKTIKLSKNITYLTERLPKPNYSSNKHQSVSSNKSAIIQYHSGKISGLSLNLPPVMSKRSSLIQSAIINHKSGISHIKDKNKSLQRYND